MDFRQFLAAVDGAQQGRMPQGLPLELQVPWLERRGDWAAAHDVAQDMPDPNGALLHAYLHRREGDNGNAAYWYRRADHSVATGSLDEEWRSLARHFSTESS